MKRIPRRPKEHVRDHEDPAVDEDLSVVRIGSLVRASPYGHVGRVVRIDNKGLVKVDPDHGSTHGWFPAEDLEVMAQPNRSVNGETRSNPARGADMREIDCEVDALALRAIRDHLLDDMAVKGKGGLRRAFILIDKLVEAAEDSLAARDDGIEYSGPQDPQDVELKPGDHVVLLQPRNGYSSGTKLQYIGKQAWGDHYVERIDHGSVSRFAVERSDIGPVGVSLP